MPVEQFNKFQFRSVLTLISFSVRRARNEKTSKWMSFFVSCVWLDLNLSLLRSPKATEGVGEQVKTILNRFHEAINENKEHDEPSVSEASRRSQATIFSEGQQIPPPQPE